MNSNDKRLGAYQKTMQNGKIPSPAQKVTTTDSPLRSSPESPLKDSSGLLKIPRKDGRESSYRRVAKFLLLIGIDEAAQIVSRLDENQVEKVMLELSTIRSVPKDESTVILAEFESLLKQAREPLGGVGTARSILEGAFGKERAAEMLEKAVPTLHGKPFDYLQNINGEKLYRLIKGELSSAKALVLSQTKPEIAAQVIKLMDDDEKKETVFRLARMGSVSPEVLRRVDETMREKVEAIDMPSEDTIDGRSALASILKKMDGQSEKSILNRLENTDPELGRDIRDRLFTYDDIIRADDVYLQGVLRTLSDHDFAVLITGKSDALRSKLLSNVSKNRRNEVLEEEKLIVPLTRQESRQVTESFYQVVRTAWEDGKFRLSDDLENDEWVD
ncbi:MAG TPA: flagellar motor switch protein FliG [Treponema sp.]|nr:flagellar motor switch protein FliG [Treponema sp.]